MTSPAALHQEYENLNTYGTEGEINSSKMSALIDELETLRIAPFIPCDSLGIDGITYGIKFGRSYRLAEFSWWCDAPEAWQELSDWYHKTVELLEQSLPISTPEM